jgi:hypothetical protein
LLNALQVAPYSRKETNVEHKVIEAVIDTNYRRLIDGRSIDISLGGVHNIVVDSDIDKMFQEDVPLQDLSGIMAESFRFPLSMMESRVWMIFFQARLRCNAVPGTLPGDFELLKESVENDPD